MKLVVPHESLRSILRWTQLILFACAIPALAYTVFVAMDAWNFQNQQRLELDRLLIVRGGGLHPIAHVPALAASGLIGNIEIPSVGISAMVVEGTSSKTLRRAAGHISGTALPGQAGNIGISGHRDTFFRPLRNIHQNDIVKLTTMLGEFRYRVVSTRIVGPADVGVLDPDGTEVLTLVTCYPFYFVGSAPDRFVVRAERVRDTL